MSVRLSLAGYAVTGVTLVTLLAACAASEPSDAPATPVSTVTATETSTITVTPSTQPRASQPAPATAVPAPKSTFAFDRGVSGMLVHNLDGSEYMVRIKFGPLLTHANTGMKTKQFRLGDTCPFSPATDAVVQFVMMVSSHKANDTTVWNLEVRPSRGSSKFPVRAELFATNTGNLNCVGDDTAIYQNGGSLGSDGYREVYGNIIIPGYKVANDAKARLMRSPLLFKVSGAVVYKTPNFGSRQSTGYNTLPIG